MKNLTSLLLIAAYQLIFSTSIAQQSADLPDIGIYPDYMISSGIIDSVLQYSDFENGDSAMLRRWNYIHQDDNNYHESHKYYWNEFLGEWNLKQKHEYSCDNKGRYLLKAHYDYYDARHDRWRGCSSEGCGKREWRYNLNGILCMESQSYWCNADWRIFNRITRDSVWDTNGRLLFAISYEEYRNECSDVTRGGGEKSEFQYDITGNPVCEIRYRQDDYYDPNGWHPYEKNEYSYDASGNRLGHVHYWWHIYRQDWVPDTKEEKVYDSYDKMISTSRYHWSGASTGWEPIYSNWGFGRIEWKYDSLGVLKNTICYKWNPSREYWNEIVNEEIVYNDIGRNTTEIRIVDRGFYYEFYVQKISYEYDASGHKTMETSVYWDFTNNEWKWIQDYDEGPHKTEYSYDQWGNVILEIRYEWDETDSWAPYRKLEYAYDEAGYQTLFASFYWYRDANIWQGYKVEYSYDKWGNIVMSTRYELNTTNTWQPDTMEIREFNESGRMLLEAFYEWDVELNTWKGNESRWDYYLDRRRPGKTEFAYDENNNLTLYAAYQWDDDGKDWIGGHEYNGLVKREWAYNSDDSITQEIHYEWAKENDDWEGKFLYLKNFYDSGDPEVQQLFTWDSDLSEWKLANKLFYYYRSNVTGKINSIYPDIVLFPNPTSGYIYVKGVIQPCEIKIHNLQGQLLKTFHQVTNTIDVTGLQPGVYILHIDSGDQRVVRKMVIQ